MEFKEDWVIPRRRRGRRYGNENRRNYASCNWGCDVATTEGGKPQMPCEGILIFVSGRVKEPLERLSEDMSKLIIGSTCSIALGRKD